MDMKEFMRNQIREALKYKWCKGVALKCDPGPQAISEWIEKYAAKYREEYEKCIEKLINQTTLAVEKRLADPNCEREKIRLMTKMIIEEFTKIWFLEMTTGDNPHIGEV